MKHRHAIPESTLAAQRRASDPQASAWVSAHAGSGKTHVLTQRVIRLLLEGSQPSKILCLTYTRTAAANMSSRVFDTLSAWTRLDDIQLAAAIENMGAPVTPARLQLARRLFARAVETPGGLKIQTIHAFCERLLKMFPFEANLPSRFEMIDDMQRGELLADAKRRVLSAALAAPDSETGAALAHLSAVTSQENFDKLIQSSLSMRRYINTGSGEPHSRAAYGARLAPRLGLQTGDDMQRLADDILAGAPPVSDWSSMADRLEAGIAKDAKFAAGLREACMLNGPAQAFAYLQLFLTQTGPGTSPVISAGIKKLDRPLFDAMQLEQSRMGAEYERKKALHICENTAALVVIADAMLQAYETAKQARGWLDFDDLIDKTLSLLTRTSSGWVLYKLDAGIDHVLLDEAQDTSPEQWEVLQRIAEEFTAGAGQRSGKRTFFAVGDEKQSIYSFQGARPEKFNDMKKHFGAKTRQAEQAFHEVKLDLSFRSTEKVLEAVDKVFADAERRRGLSTDDDVALAHQALKRGLPGLVELWEPVTPQPPVVPADWRPPIDAPKSHDAEMVLARRISEMVRDWIDPASPERVIDSHSGEPRPIRAGDIIILVRKRRGVFGPLIAALKDAGVPVAGADRLKFAEHIAVMDLVAVGRAALLPDDDLSLACLLKSPLMGLDDDDLIALAPQRKGSLFEALKRSTTPAHQQCCVRLERWRDWVHGATPFIFYAKLLGAEGGRRDLVARLGAEAGDAIDEFLAQTLAHERLSPPSMTIFLAALEKAENEVKRDMDAATDAVRVMTAHGAKGLEAKIVLLADTCSAPTSPNISRIFVLDDGVPGSLLAWSSKKIDEVAVVQQAHARVLQAEADEHRRLLYVAMTRAEERLYIMGATKLKGRAAGSWHEMLEAALKPHATPAPAAWQAGEQVWRLADVPASVFLSSAAPALAATARQAPLPTWLTTHVPREYVAPPPFRPSTALASSEIGSFARGRREDGAGVDALRFGSLVHVLLQNLPDTPSALRQSAANAFLARRAPWLDAPQRNALAGQALRVLDHPALALLFGPGSRAEVAVSGKIAIAPGRSIEILGQIDRLVRTPSELIFADFKTGRAVDLASTPTTYLGQLALYHLALVALHPQHKVRALLVWTQGPCIVEIPPETLALAVAHLNVDPIGVAGDASLDAPDPAT